MFGYGSRQEDWVDRAVKGDFGLNGFLGLKILSAAMRYAPECTFAFRSDKRLYLMYRINWSKCTNLSRLGKSLNSAWI